jgi:hypothetical protein
MLIDRRWHSIILDGHHFKEPGFGGRIVLRWNFRKWDVEPWTGSIWLRIGTSGGLL